MAGVPGTTVDGMSSGATHRSSEQNANIGDFITGMQACIPINKNSGVNFYM